MKELPDHTIIQQVLAALEEKAIKDPHMFGQLCNYINQLIAYDFERLVSLLYRIDVREDKIKHMLRQQQGVNTAETIAELIIERQLQKLKSRQENRRDQEDIDAEEGW